MMKLIIDPCKACLQKFDRPGKEPCNVNDIRDCCYDTLNAFIGPGSTNTLSNSEVVPCETCIQAVMAKRGPFGKTKIPCDFQISRPPVWNQVPHHFPGILEQLGVKEENLDTALSLCITACNGPNKEECKIACQTDRNAVCTKENPKVKKGKKGKIVIGGDGKIVEENKIPWWILILFILGLIGIMYTVKRNS
jgi:hypothetical protein